MRRILLSLVVLCAAARAMAEVQFLGVMADSKRMYFALRTDETAATKWITLGQAVGDFTVTSYDPEIEALTLSAATKTTVLKLPVARVKMAVDEVVDGLSKILNLPGAQSRRDLLHPKLRPFFKDSDLNAGFEHVLEPGTINEIQPLTQEGAKALEEGLSAIEKITGSRPKYGLWTKRGNGRAMSFVVNVGDAWYLAPGVPAIRAK